jgi:hypothetical protein
LKSGGDLDFEAELDTKYDKAFRSLLKEALKGFKKADKDIKKAEDDVKKAEKKGAGLKKKIYGSKKEGQEGL